MYSPELLQRFLEPKWVGDVASPAAVVTEGNPACGDVVQLSIEIIDGVITEARFRTLGCAVAISASDAVCSILEGKTLSAAAFIDTGDVASVLGGIPDERLSCAGAALAAVRSVLREAQSTVEIS